MPAPTAQHALLSGLIDYAGLFPPAALDVGAAAAAYARERAGAQAWMLGRFLVPAARLGTLGPHAAAMGAAGPLHLSVLGPPPGEASAWLAGALAAVDEAEAFEAAQGGRAVADRFEAALPAALARDADALAADLGALDARLKQRAARGGEPARVAVEVPYVAHPDALEPAAHALAEANARAARPAFALKLRCGGAPDLVPTPEALAAALTAARRAGVAVKATAGLHHPLRAPDAAGRPAHGFVNVFGGAALAARHGLATDDLAEILDAADGWTLGETLAWRALAADGPDVAHAREAVALSYGSCSFDEPRDDLRALGWLEP